MHSTLTWEGLSIPDQHSIPAPAWVRMFDFVRGYQVYRDEFQAAIDRVLASGRLVMGDEVARFEAEFAAVVGSRFGIGVNSGFDALRLALLALNIGPGDEVITVANTAVATAAAIRAVGAVPRFVDVEPATLVMNPAAAARAITPRTRCLVPVHLYGHPADMSALVDLAARHDLKIVEDCSHAHGAAWQKQHVGTFGQIGCFSCYPTKNLGAFGDAGICVTSDPQLAARLGALRQYGFNEDRVADSDGQNSRLDELQAAILRVRLAHFRETLGHRRSMAGEYLQQLAGTSLVLPCQSPGAVHAFHLFVVRSAQRSRLIERLAANHIDCAVHYPRPLHRMPAFQVFVTAADDLSVTEQAAAEVLSLPLFTGISRREIDRVAKVLLEVARS